MCAQTTPLGGANVSLSGVGVLGTVQENSVTAVGDDVGDSEPRALHATERFKVPDRATDPVAARQQRL